MRVKTSALISILLFSIIYAQNFSITGYVKDAKNGNILVGANVFIVGTSLGTSAREDGQYKINNVKPGTYSVKQKLPLKGLEIFLNMNNITEAVDKNRYHTSNSLALEQHYGKTIDLGLKYSF